MDITQQSTDSTTLQEIGARLAQYRLNRNLTQEQLAREAGVSLSTLNRMESGKSSQTTNLIRVLRALDLLANIDLIVPPPAISPLQQLQLEGKTRKRARPKKADSSKRSSAQPWTWDLK